MSDPVTAPTPDAVAQARDRVLDAMPSDCREVIEIAERDVDALIAAVRAECAAKVRAIPSIAIDTERHPSLAGVDVDLCHRSDILTALEAK